MDPKIRVLFLCDDIRTYSGVGIQANKLLTGLALKKDTFEIAQIGSVVNRAPRPDPILYEGVTIYEHPTFGDPYFTRQVMGHFKPDIIIPMGDPRFFTYLFSMDGDIRKRSKLVFYHLWDNFPFPKFNEPWYKACDELVTLTRFTHELYNANSLENTLITHGYDDKEFYKLEEKDYIGMKGDIIRGTKRDDIDFIALWNNRNMHRKRGADVIEAFHRFYADYPHSLLIMHTDPISMDGYDLIGVNNDLERFENTPVVFSVNKDKSPMLNRLYNLADVSVNVSYNEGFGLCVGESQLAETPVIANSTGGITEQLVGGDDNSGESVGILLQPDVQHLFGVPGGTYVYQDFVSIDKIADAFRIAYNLKKNKGLDEFGKKARELTKTKYNIKDTISKWEKYLLEIRDKKSTFKPYRNFIIP